MEKVESYHQFGEKVREFKKSVRKVSSNCYFLPGEVRKMTEKGNLYVEESPECILFFVREALCSRLYYYLEDGKEPVVKRQDVPVFLDFVYREENEAQESGILRIWEKQGFQIYKKYRRMECLRENFIPPADEEEMEKRFPPEFLKPEDYEECLDLWTGSLDVYSTLLPDLEEFSAACEKNQIMGIRLPDGHVGAVDRGIFKGRTAFMQHLSVSPKLRGVGMGRTLCYASIAAMFHRCGAEKVNFWVDEKNSHAIGIYERMGFVNDGMISGQLKLEKK